LEEEFQSESSLILPGKAHLNILFSCAAFLNSCISLLPDHSTPLNRAAVIVRGFHGLLPYADMFWYRHLLAYCNLQDQRTPKLSQEVLTQLCLLVRFKKHEAGDILDTGSDSTEEPGLEALSHLPDVKSLIREIIVFRRKNGEQSSDRSPEGKTSGSEVQYLRPDKLQKFPWPHVKWTRPSLALSVITISKLPSLF
jgi:hypothetical protein